MVDDWPKLLSAGGTCGILALLVWYLLTRFIPQMQDASKQTLDKVLTESKGSLDKVLDDSAAARKQFGEELDRERQSHRDQLASLHQQFHERDKLLIEQLQRGK